MNKSDKIKYYRRFSKFQQNRERAFAPKFYKLIQEQYQTVITNLGQGIQAVELLNPLHYSSLIQKLYLDAAIVYGAKIRADLNQKKARMPIAFNEIMYQRIVEYFGTDILNTSIGITDTTKMLIRNILTEAYKEGWDYDKIVGLLQATELSRVRARMIARTETVTAANTGAILVAKETGLKLKKEWLSAMDNRTRRDHLYVNGTVINMDEYFNVGGYQMYQPGDRGGKDGRPEVAAKEIVNCRCAILFTPIKS